MKYPIYCNSDDRKAVMALIDTILTLGYSITINDTEDDVITKSTDELAIRKEMAGAGEDEVLVHDDDGKIVGWFFLIYDNGSEGDPMVVICDYSSNEICDEIWAMVQAEVEA